MKVPFIHELVDAKYGAADIPGFETEEIMEMLNYQFFNLFSIDHYTILCLRK